jgi:hypothetical protein
MRRTDTEVMEELKSNSNLNCLRQIFSGWSAKIEQASMQRQSLSPIEMRRMEFEAVDAILAALNVEVQS